METEPVLIPLENDGDLVITFDRGYRVAEVRRAGLGVSPRGVFLVRPGESLYDVPYEAWLARVDQSVRLRELREHRPAEAPPPAGGKAFPTRTGNSFWTTELGPKATLVFMLSVYLAHVPIGTTTHSSAETARRSSSSPASRSWTGCSSCCSTWACPAGSTARSSRRSWSSCSLV